MRKPLLILSLLIFLIYACNQTVSLHNSLLNAAALNSQLVTIDITKDTTLHTKKRAVIKIPKGTLSANGATTVQLEIKEAYSIHDMLLAGLTTQSNGVPLSSGGMICIQPTGGNPVTINQPISIAIPATYIDKKMQLFRGEPGKGSSINWTDPQPLPVNPQNTALEQGQILFYHNCAPCHGIGRDLVAPDLLKNDRMAREANLALRYMIIPAIMYFLQEIHISFA